MSCLVYTCLLLEPEYYAVWGKGIEKLYLAHYHLGFDKQKTLLFSELHM